MLNLGIPHVSREFHRFAQAVSDSRSKQEEERLVSREISLLRLNFQNKNVSKNQLKDYLLRCLYIEMLGFNTKFAYIHAINMAQDKQLAYKYTGYLCCMMMLDSKSDLLLLLVNTIQKDLLSPNFMDRLMVLNSLCALVNEEMLPIVLPLVSDCLAHENALIRKRTVVLLTRMYELFPCHLGDHVRQAIEKGLCDADPSVMNVTLNLLQIHIGLNEAPAGGTSDQNTGPPRAYINHRTIAAVLLNIWKQVLDNRLSRDYNYHRVHGPFIQLNLLRLLTLLNRGGRVFSPHGAGASPPKQPSDSAATSGAAADSSLSGGAGEGVPVTGRADASVPSAFVRDFNATLYKFVQSIEKASRPVVSALVYQFVQLLATVSLDDVLTNISSQLVTRSLAGTCNDQYVAISAACILIEKGVSLSFDDQVKIISLLQEDDLTIQKVIIRLLYRLINRHNYQVVVTQLVEYIRRDYIIDREEIIYRIIGYCTMYGTREAKGGAAGASKGLTAPEEGEDAEREGSKRSGREDMSIVNVVLQIVEILSSGKGLVKADEVLNGIIRFIARHRSQAVNSYVLGKCFQMYSSSEPSELLVKLMIWLVKYMLLINVSNASRVSEANEGNDANDTANNARKGNKRTADDDFTSSDPKYVDVGGEPELELELDVPMEADGGIAVDAAEDDSGTTAAKRHGCQLYREVLAKILARPMVYNEMLLHWVLNNYRQIVILANGGGAIGQSGDGPSASGASPNGEVEVLLASLGDKYVGLIRQVLVEIGNLNASGLAMRLNSGDYDAKLSFLKEYVDAGVTNGAKQYDRNAVMAKYRPTRVERPVSEDEEAGKLIYKPYLLMETTSIEVGSAPLGPAHPIDVMAGAPGVPGESAGVLTAPPAPAPTAGADRLVLAGGLRSWGPRGYNPQPSLAGAVRSSARATTSIGLDPSRAPAEQAMGSTPNPSDRQTMAPPAHQNPPAQPPDFNLDHVVLDRLEASRWGAKSLERQKNEELAKQLFKSD